MIQNPVSYNPGGQVDPLRGVLQAVLRAGESADCDFYTFDPLEEEWVKFSEGQVTDPRPSGGNDLPAGTIVWCVFAYGRWFAARLC